MKAIVRQAFGGPEQLQIREVPAPALQSGEVLIRVRAFGINRAEQYFRLGAWGPVADISGIECVGEVIRDTSGALMNGQRVFALMGGLGRSRNGSYAEQVAVPASNVIPIRSTLDWALLAALPESYATAWSCLFENLGLRRGNTVLIRGASSALGRAALDLARHQGARVFAAVRSHTRIEELQALGAEAVVQEGPDVPAAVRKFAPKGIDAVLDLVGTRTILESLQLARRGGRVCMAGFLGGHEPLTQFDPLQHMPSGRQLSFFGSAFVYGTADYPLTDIPFQKIVDWVEGGELHCKPARIFSFDEIQSAHRLLDADGAGGKMVVLGPE